MLSIAVSRDAQLKGIGKALMLSAMQEFSRRGVGAVKVSVAKTNGQAIRYYNSCGFELNITRDHHGQPMCILVAQVKKSLEALTTEMNHY